MEEKVYVAWRDPIERSWHPVGILTVDENDTYNFVYTRGAMKSNFVAFARMKDKNSVYRSNELFHLFSNRILPVGRPEYNDYLNWLDIDEISYSPFKMLAITEGIKATDNLEFFQCPGVTSSGKLEVKFLIHGLRYFQKEAIARINKLEQGEELFLMPDIQNKYDPNAMALRTDDPVQVIGYCPRFLSPDIHKLLKENKRDDVKVTVKKVNKDAPINLRLLCNLVASWPDNFKPCDEEEFEPVIHHSNYLGLIRKAKTPKSSVGVLAQSSGDFTSMDQYDDNNGISKSQMVRSITSSMDEYKKGGKMTMKNYAYGRRKELKVARSLRGKGASVKMSPGSRGAADLKASFSPTRKWNVQVKASRGPSPASPSRRDLGRLKQGASRTGATPVLAKVTPKGTTYKSARTGRTLKP